MSDSLKKGAVKLLTIRLVGKALAFFLFMLLARQMTVSSYGELMYLFSLIAIFTVISPLGLDVLILRRANTFIAEKQYGNAKGLYQFSSRISLLVGSVLAVLMIVGLEVTNGIGNVSREMIIGIYAIITLTGYMAIRRNFLLSLKKSIAAELPETVIRPILAIIIILFVVAFNDTSLSASLVMIIVAVSWIVVTVSGKLWFDQQVTPLFSRPAKYQTHTWIMSGMPIMVVTLGFTSMAEIDVIILANMSSVEDSAVYSVATRYMQLFSLPLGVMQSISASSLALYHQRKKASSFSALASKLSKISFLIAIPIFITLLLFSDMFLALFGEDYKKGSVVLLILAFMATLNAWFGSTGYSLTMTGRQMTLAKLILLALAVNIILDVILIPIMGIEGAAIATFISTVGWNVVAILYIKNKLGYLIVWLPFRNYGEVN